MKRIPAVLASALIGSVVGYAARTALIEKPAPGTDIVITASPAVAAGATLLGLFFGRKRLIVAFLAAVIGTATLGDRLDRMLTDSRRSTT